MWEVGYDVHCLGDHVSPWYVPVCGTDDVVETRRIPSPSCEERVFRHLLSESRTEKMGDEAEPVGNRPPFCLPDLSFPRWRLIGRPTYDEKIGRN